MSDFKEIAPETPTQAKVRKKKLAAVIEDLQSTEEVLVLDAVERLKQVGDGSAVPFLVDAYFRLDSEQVRAACKKVLFSVNDPEAVQHLLQAAMDRSEDIERAMVVSAIWESGLDAQPYLETMMELVKYAGYRTNMEIMTILDNMSTPSEERVKAALLTLKDRLSDSTDELRPLIETMAMTLQDKLIG